MRRAALLVLAVLVLAPAGVRAAMCRRAAGSMLRAAGCCPAEAGSARPGRSGRSAPDSEMRAACCCTLSSLAAREAPERAAPPAAAMVPPPVAQVASATPPPREAVPVIAFDRPRATRGPPDLFVRHCALLL